MHNCTFRKILEALAVSGILRDEQLGLLVMFFPNISGDVAHFRWVMELEFGESWNKRIGPMNLRDIQERLEIHWRGLGPKFRGPLYIA